MRIPAVLLSAFCVVLCIVAHAQQKPEGPARIEILGADRWDFDKKLVDAQRLIGHVRFKHADALMDCDSAYLFEDQTLRAFGHVGITQGDTLHITGARLDYNGADRMAHITGDVRLSDPGMDMTTDALTYDLRQHVAHYSSGARIVSRKEQNTLTSRNGSYFSATRTFMFSDHVRLEHPERVIEADTLHYITSTGMAEFFGPTRIVQGDSASGITRLWCDRGSYDTRAERGRFTRNGRIVSKGQELRGDSLHYDRASGGGEAWGHVQVIDTAQHITVLGDRGTHNERTANSMITGTAQLIMRMGIDSLFLHADTLFASQDSGGKRIVARRGARFFKSDMQGVCDTMVYTQHDSLIELHGAPFLWNGKDQISGRTITIALREGKPHRMHVLRDALLAGQADSTRFNQVTGTKMTGYFGNGELKKLIAEGNTRTVYWAKEKKDSTERITGMDRTDCSRIEVLLDSGKVRSISFLTKPDATLYPPDKAPPDQVRMKGFVWNEAARPRDRADIFRRAVADAEVDAKAPPLIAPPR